MSEHAKVALVNRRYLRVKVFQALYAYYRTEGADTVRMERDLFDSINRLNLLYLYLVGLLIEVHDAAIEMTEQAKAKKLPTHEDLNPNTRFIENRVFKKLRENVMIQQLLAKNKINWKNEHDDIRKMFRAFRATDTYALYAAREEMSLEVDKSLVVTLFSQHLGLNDLIHSVLEEKDIYWQDDLPVAAVTLIKTIQNLGDFDTTATNILADLYKNKEEDLAFVKELFRKTIQFGADYETVIAAKADNWEVERIALLDMIMMKMALTELEHFATVPVKVTLNEYIELAKSYSTPKSKMFINGVLDKLVAEWKTNGRIQKRGRGLME